MNAQHLHALQVGNTRRLRRPTVKHGLRDGTLSLDAALADPAVASMRTVDLLVWLPWPRTSRRSKYQRAVVLAGLAGCSEYRLVSELSVRQVGVLVDGWAR